MRESHKSLRQRVVRVVAFAFAAVAVLIPTRTFAGQPRLDLQVAIVDSNLSVRAVPKWQFEIRNVDEPSEIYSLTTSFEGTAMIELHAGSFEIFSVKPVQFEDHNYSWEVVFVMPDSGSYQLELSNDNAQVVALEPRSSQSTRELTEGELYSQMKSSVFTVESEFGRGSGFLVDTSGLVLTNSHVVHNSGYLAVQINSKEKFPAVLIAENHSSDVAVLRIHPSTVSSLRPLTLADDDPLTSPVQVGDRVVAIGSPLSTRTILTSGLVSKVERDALLSDVSIDHGSSGGPLINRAAEVVGITTFGIGSISGVVRIHVAASLVDEARTRKNAPLPSPRNLPVASDFSFPADELRRASLSIDVRPRDYHLEAGKIDVQFITPLAIAHQEVAAEKEAAEFRGRRNRRRQETKNYEPGSDFYEWRRYAGDYRPVVTIQAIPEIGLTGGSIAVAVLAGLGGVAPGPLKYKFKTDFERMELVRNGAVVEPITPSRVAQVMSAQTESGSISDIAFYGAYSYHPEVFAPGSNLTLKIWEQGRQGAIVRDIPQPLVSRIWSEFRPYFASIAASQAPSRTTIRNQSPEPFQIRTPSNVANLPLSGPTEPEDLAARIVGTIEGQNKDQITFSWTLAIENPNESSVSALVSIQFLDKDGLSLLDVVQGGVAIEAHETTVLTGRKALPLEFGRQVARLGAKVSSRSTASGPP